VGIMNHKKLKELIGNNGGWWEKICVIYFAIINYITMRCGSWMVKALVCGQGGEG